MPAPDDQLMSVEPEAPPAPEVIHATGSLVTLRMPNGATLNVARPAAERLLGGGIPLEFPPKAQPPVLGAPVAGVGGTLAESSERPSLANPSAGAQKPPAVGVPPMLARAEEEQPTQMVTPKVSSGFGGMGMFMQGQKMRESALGQAAGAIDTETEANKKLAALESQRLQARGEGMRANVEKQQNDLTVLQNQHDMAMNQIEHERRALMSQKVDPNRYWKEKSTGGKVLTAIGLALGTLGSSLGHQPNYALDLYKKAIDDDIDAQHAEINKSKDALNLRHNLIAERMRSGMSLLAAEASARMTMIDAADTMLMSHSGEARNMLADAAAQKLHAFNEDQRGQLKQALGVALMQQAAAQNKGMTFDQAMKLNERAVFVPGEQQPRYAASPERAKEASAAVRNYSDTKDTLERMRDLVNNKWESLPLSEAKAKMKALHDKLTAQTGQAFHLGVLSESDKELAQPIGDPTNWSQRSSVTNGLIDQMEEQLSNGIQSHFGSEGLGRYPVFKFHQGVAK